MDYWDKYYADNKLQEPSLFSNYVFSEIKKHNFKSIIDIGCGNGRDSVYFGSKNLDTLGIDNSLSSIKYLKNFEKNNLSFKKLDISNINKLKKKFEVAYCRFIFHSINNNLQQILFNWLAQNVTKMIFIENRINDFSEYENYEQNHYRNIQSSSEFLKLIKDHFNNFDYEISNKFSPYKRTYNVDDINFDPYLLRVQIKVN